jgi:hypothetical protein
MYPNMQGMVKDRLSIGSDSPKCNLLLHRFNDFADVLVDSLTKWNIIFPHIATSAPAGVGIIGSLAETLIRPQSPILSDEAVQKPAFYYLIAARCSEERARQFEHLSSAWDQLQSKDATICTIFLKQYGNIGTL